jgi:hypothetical protein
MKPLYSCALRLLLFFFLPSAISAQCFHPANYNLHRSPAFLENKGQIVDQNGHQDKDVRFIYDNHQGLKLILKEHSFSFELYTFCKILGNISEATGQPMLKNRTMNREIPEPFTVKLNRIDVKLKGSNSHPEIISEGRSRDYVNYYKEYTGENGITDIHYYSKVTYKNIYKNIDFVFLAQQDGSFKYNIIVHPGGRLTDVKMIYEGMKTLYSARNKISLESVDGIVEESIPMSYIQETGEKVKVAFAPSNNRCSFIAENKKGTLVIDPLVRNWGTYLGGSGDDEGRSAVMDTLGNIYMAGYTSSSSGIAITGSYQATIKGNYDAFIVKFDSSGKPRWATYYGGSNEDEAYSISIDKSGILYIGGQTKSTSGIASAGAYQNSLWSTTYYDAFLLKFNSNGYRLWGTYFGGNGDDFGYTTNVDASGNIYLAGWTQSNAGLASNGSYQTSFGGYDDAFLVKFNSNCVRQWATYFGGDNYEFGYSVAADDSENVYLTGVSWSSANIASSNGFQNKFGGGLSDAFVVKFNKSGSRRWASYYGGNNNDEGDAIAIDKHGNIYMAGWTYSTSAIATSGCYQDTNRGAGDAFLVKFTRGGSRLWGTYFGGSGDDYFRYIKIDKSENLYLTGETQSPSDISTGVYQDTLSGKWDALMVKFTSNDSLLWSTYYGGQNNEFGKSAMIDHFGNVYLAGYSLSTNGISSANAYQSINGGNQDAFLVKFKEKIPFLKDTVFCAGATFGWSANISDNVTVRWYINDSFVSSDSILWHTYKVPGHYKIALVVNDNGFSDSVHAGITILPAPSFTVSRTIVQNTVHFVVNDSSSADTYFWDFGDGNSSTDRDPVHIYLKDSVYQVTLTVTNASGCESIYTEQLGLQTGISPINFPSFKLLLYPNPVQQKLTIECTGNNCDQTFQLSISSMNGKILLKDAWTSDRIHSLDVSSLCSGSYLLKIDDGRNVSVQVLVKR